MDRIEVNLETQEVRVIPLTDAEVAEGEAGQRARQAEIVRSERDRLLAASDWTQVADAPVNQAAWAAYRQALRDLPQQDGFPRDVIWPTTPE